MPFSRELKERAYQEMANNICLVLDIEPVKFDGPDSFFGYLAKKVDDPKSVNNGKYSVIKIFTPNDNHRNTIRENYWEFENRYEALEKMTLEYLSHYFTGNYILGEFTLLYSMLNDYHVNDDKVYMTVYTNGGKYTYLMQEK